MAMDFGAGSGGAGSITSGRVAAKPKLRMSVKPKAPVATPAKVRPTTSAAPKARPAALAAPRQQFAKPKAPVYGAPAPTYAVQGSPDQSATMGNRQYNAVQGSFDRSAQNQAMNGVLGEQNARMQADRGMQASPFNDYNARTAAMTRQFGGGFAVQGAPDARLGGFDPRAAVEAKQQALIRALRGY